MARDTTAGREKIFTCTTCQKEFSVERVVTGPVATSPHETSFFFKELGRRSWRATCDCGTVEGFSLIDMVRKVGDRGQ